LPKLGLCEEALAAIDEAAAIRRELAAALPHVYRIPARIPLSQTAPDMIRLELDFRIFGWLWLA
jgi:hypothetical protein